MPNPNPPRVRSDRVNSSGRYRVTLLHDHRGNLAGAELVRIDGEHPPWPIRLTPIQWGLLEGTEFIERS